MSPAQLTAWTRWPSAPLGLRPAHSLLGQMCCLSTDRSCFLSECGCAVWVWVHPNSRECRPALISRTRLGLHSLFSPDALPCSACPAAFMLPEVRVDEDVRRPQGHGSGPSLNIQDTCRLQDALAQVPLILVTEENQFEAWRRGDGSSSGPGRCSHSAAPRRKCREPGYMDSSLVLMMPTSRQASVECTCPKAAPGAWSPTVPASGP